jgi:hypothetical protein
VAGRALGCHGRPDLIGSGCTYGQPGRSGRSISSALTGTRAVTKTLAALAVAAAGRDSGPGSMDYSYDTSPVRLVQGARGRSLVNPTYNRSRAAAQACSLIMSDAALEDLLLLKVTGLQPMQGSPAGGRFF